MTQFFRLLWLVAAALLRPALGLFDESVLAFRVWPTEVDINLHMNNARYLAVMDLGRWDCVLRSGLWRMVMKRRVQPVLGGTVVRFRRSLRPFQAYSLRTRLVTWDERWIYVEHRMESADGLACWAEMRVAFVGRTGIVRPSDVIKAAGGAGVQRPPLPSWVQSWRDFDAGMDQPASNATDGSMSCAH